MLRNNVKAYWTKEDVMTSLNHAKQNGTMKFILSTESSIHETKLNVVKWLKELGHRAEILKDGTVEVNRNF
jgi:hypothetical protein